MNLTDFLKFANFWNPNNTPNFKLNFANILIFYFLKTFCYLGHPNCLFFKGFALIDLEPILVATLIFVLLKYPRNRGLP